MSQMGLREEQKNLTEWVEGKRRSQKKKKKFPQFNTFILFWDSLSAFCYTRVYKGSEGMGKRDFQPNRVINICKDLPSLCKKIIFSRSLCAL